ncbi:hypothetical protein [Providencia alcalifaciens]|uniref:hypothetical protein n=1 Tax=Providencia alcalifaciens TaxID=126385 RepID=UPI000D335652|nr:hypothetical protein [Providencia alcalifaciens]MBG5883989.1 hypothetical protein [Providencia alcalifaciens]
MKNDFFYNRRILLIAPSFYSYNELIKNELELLGAKVYMVDERPSNNSLFKIILRIKASLVSTYIENYYDKIAKIYKDYELTDVFFINPEAVNEFCMKNLKMKIKNAKFTLYMWDSLKNKKHASLIFKYFDNLYSFDPNDVKEHSNLRLQPLFYNKNLLPTYTNNNYDISFFGSIHSDRLAILSQINSYHHIKSKIYIYSPSIILTVVKLLQQKKLSLYDYKRISHSKISFDEIKQDIENSKCILDIHHPDQNGLTMRTFEALGSCKKLITTNENICHYDFYNDTNILIIDRKNINVNSIENFLKKDFDSNQNSKILKYRIDNWLMEVLH